MIGSTADYVSMVAAKLPGQTWEYYADQLPLAIGLQLRNAELADRGAELLPPGQGAASKLSEILGEHAEDWL